jgi:hypothetical protein
MAKGIAAAVSALLTSLREEGALPAGDPGPAPWGSRVDLRATSDVVQIAGAGTGDPQALTWPCLLLFGPQVREVKKMQRPASRFEANFQAGARTVETRRWPRYYDVTFQVRWQTRSGVNTAGTTASAQSLAGIVRWEKWIATHRSLNEDGIVFSEKPLSVPAGARVTIADVIEAVGEIRIAWLQEFDAAATVVPADHTLDVDVHRARTL